MPRFMPSVYLFERRRNVGEREEELGANGPKEVLACLGGLIAEIEVVVEVGNASLMGVPLEMTDSGGAFNIAHQPQSYFACVAHQRTLFPLPAVAVQSMSDGR